MKEQIITILKKAGFRETGKNQFHNDGSGTIFLKEYTATELVYKLMNLGEKHRAYKIRQALFVEDNFQFKPQA